MLNPTEDPRRNKTTDAHSRKRGWVVDALLPFSIALVICASAAPHRLERFNSQLLLLEGAAGVISLYWTMVVLRGGSLKRWVLFESFGNPDFSKRGTRIAGGGRLGDALARNPAERRKESRFSVGDTGSIECISPKSVSQPIAVVNVSSSGLCLAAPVQMKVGLPVMVSFRGYLVVGEVVRCRTSDTGFDIGVALETCLDLKTLGDYACRAFGNGPRDEATLLPAGGLVNEVEDRCYSQSAID